MNFKDRNNDELVCDDEKDCDYKLVCDPQGNYIELCDFKRNDF